MSDLAGFEPMTFCHMCGDYSHVTVFLCAPLEAQRNTTVI
jgi:hypothetical protein